MTIAGSRLPPTLLRVNSNSPTSKPGSSNTSASTTSAISSSTNSTATSVSAATSYNNTVIVFDWDDTFFPTSALERNRLLRIPCQKLRPQVVAQLNHLAQTCIDTLNLAEKYGKVLIITNSAPGWIDTSCQAFMPLLHPKIRSYPIFAKPMNYMLTYKLDVFKREMLHGRYTNLVSVGDGIAERTATLRLIGTTAGGLPCHCKSVKLKDTPTMGQLVEQLELTQKRFENLVRYEADLDLRTNFGPVHAAGRGLSATGGCSFVHLSHLAGPATGSSSASLIGPAPVGNSLSFLGGATGSLTTAADNRRSSTASANENKDNSGGTSPSNRTGSHSIIGAVGGLSSVPPGSAPSASLAATSGSAGPMRGLAGNFSALSLGSETKSAGGITLDGATGAANAIMASTTLSLTNANNSPTASTAIAGTPLAATTLPRLFDSEGGKSPLLGAGASASRLRSSLPSTADKIVRSSKMPGRRPGSLSPTLSAVGGRR
ncbi:unnamed protein product [Amoebophrya sp. A25]|nr:unnamed protein product [Amoebophrya sp. A25]|eukprot:GSA25T00000326001.1